MTTADDMLTVTQAADLFGVAPPIISRLIYQEVMHRRSCPVVGRSRFIPRSHLVVLAMELRRRGHRVADPEAPQAGKVAA